MKHRMSARSRRWSAFMHRVVRRAVMRVASAADRVVRSCSRVAHASSRAQALTQLCRARCGGAARCRRGVRSASPPAFAQNDDTPPPLDTGGAVKAPTTPSSQVGKLTLDQQVKWLRAAQQSGAMEKLDDDQLVALFQSLDPLALPRYIKEGPNGYPSYEFTMSRSERIHGQWPDTARSHAGAHRARPVAHLRKMAARRRARGPGNHLRRVQTHRRNVRPPRRHHERDAAVDLAERRPRPLAIESSGARSRHRIHRRSVSQPRAKNTSRPACRARRRWK